MAFVSESLARVALRIQTSKLPGLKSANIVSLPAPKVETAPAPKMGGVDYYQKRPKDCLFETRNLSILEQRAFDRLELNYLHQGELSGNAGDLEHLLRYETQDQKNRTE